MKKILLLIFISLSLTFVNAQNQVNVKKATVTDWIIYKGDTLSVVSVNEDTIFVVRGNTKDTLLIGGFWSVIGDSIYNNNGGDLSITGLYLPDLDEATKTGKILHINQYKEVEWMGLSGLGDDIDSARAAAPTAYTTWVRDSVNGVLSPATATDYVSAGNFKYSIADRNTIIGVGAGGSPWHTSVGDSAGYGGTGIEAISLGINAGYKAAGSYTFYAGKYAGAYDSSDFNVFIGQEAGYMNKNSSVIGIGYKSAKYNTGETSIGIGHYSLYNNSSNNVIGIGYEAAKDNNESGIYILKMVGLNTTPLQKGYFATGLTIFPKAQVDTLLTVSDSLYVAGNAEFDGTINANENINIAATTSTVGQFLHNKTRFLHTYTDNAAQPNMFIGENSGNFTTTGNYNYGFGNNTLQNNTSGGNNFAGGSNSQYSNTSGNYNMSFGTNSLYNNSTGSNNAAIGYAALYGVSGYNYDYQVAVGSSAGQYSVGSSNVAIGYTALFGGTSDGSANGINNIAIGRASMTGNIAGQDNVAIGYVSMGTNTNGSYNSAIGRTTLYNNTDGSYNSTLGAYTLYNNATGNYNLALGYSAGKYITGSYKGVIDVGDKGSYANDTTQSLLFMNFASNTLRINGAENNPKGTLANNDVSPSVAGGNVWQYNGTANSVTLDALDDHVVGAFYTIIGNSDTYTITVIDGTPAGGDSFNLAGGNWVGGSQDVLMLYCIAADAFVEVSRSDN